MPPRSNETLFTLSFGGVEFFLAPSHQSDDTYRYRTAAAEDMMSVSKICNGEVLINLNNFIGTLRIKNHNATVVNNTGNPELSEYQMRNSGNEENRSIEVLPPAAAAAAAAAAADDDDAVAPNPVEDTPSPHTKSCSETKAAAVSSKPPKGQQKLNFFDKRGGQESKKNEV
jgi:hypothetical protein